MSRLPQPVPVKLVPLDHPRIEDMLNRATREFMGTLQQVLMTQATHTRQETKQLLAQGVAIEAELVKPVHPAADQALAVMRELIEGINTGKSLELLYPKLQRLISNQERRAEIVDQLALTSDFDRLATLAQALAFCGVIAWSDYGCCAHPLAYFELAHGALVSFLAALRSALATLRLLYGRRCLHHSGGLVRVSLRTWAIG